MKANGSKASRFTQLQLANWRNFVQVRVPLQGRVFLIGPNASGKSNLLDALRFLHDLVALGGGFQEAIAKRGGVSKLRCLAARRYPDVEIGVAVGGESGQPDWEYDLSFSQDNRQRPFLRREVVKRSGEEILRRRAPKIKMTRLGCTRRISSRSTLISTFAILRSFSGQFAISTSFPSWSGKRTVTSGGDRIRSARISWSRSRARRIALALHACARLESR